MLSLKSNINSKIVKVNMKLKAKENILVTFIKVKSRKSIEMPDVIECCVYMNQGYLYSLTIQISNIFL